VQLSKNNIRLHFDLISTRSIDSVGPWPSDDFTEFTSLRFIIETSFVEHDDLPNYYDFKMNIEIC
jgi:hypothetical protein